MCARWRADDGRRKGGDEKIVAVPHKKIDAQYDGITSYTDLPQNLVDQIGHFFERYKDLEPGKWVKVTGWGDEKQAAKMIEEGMARIDG